jgi:hypothetical protein
MTRHWLLLGIAFASLLLFGCVEETPEIEGAAPSPSPTPIATTTPAGGLVITSLSATSATPFQLLTITGSGFDSNARVVVIFSDNGLYSIRVPPVSIEPSKIIVAVPPFIDRLTDNFSEGTVKVYVGQTSGGVSDASNAIEGLKINALPSPKTKPGEVTLAFLEGGAAYARTLLNEINGTALDTAQLRTAIEGKAKNFDILAKAVRSVVENNAANFDIGRASGKDLVITKDELLTVDRMIYAMLLAQASGTANLKAAPAAAAKALFFADGGGCMTQQAGNWADDISTGQFSTERSLDYYGSSGGSINCQSATAFNSGMLVVGGSAAIAGALLALAGLPAAPLAAAVLAYVTVVGGGGLILVGGTLGQSTGDARDMVIKGVDLIDGQLRSWVVGGIIGALGSYSELTGKVAEVGSAVSDLIGAAFDIHDALEYVKGIEASPIPTPRVTVMPTPGPTPRATTTPGTTPSPTPEVTPTPTPTAAAGVSLVSAAPVTCVFEYSDLIAAPYDGAYVCSGSIVVDFGGISVKPGNSLTLYAKSMDFYSEFKTNEYLNEMDITSANPIHQMTVEYAFGGHAEFRNDKPPCPSTQIKGLDLRIWSVGNYDYDVTIPVSCQ